jgi:hypothetical protein
MSDIDDRATGGHGPSGGGRLPPGLATLYTQLSRRDVVETRGGDAPALARELESLAAALAGAGDHLPDGTPLQPMRMAPSPDTCWACGQRIGR